MTDKMISFLGTAINRYGKYARHVLGFRHFAEGRDGLKPVQRRALFTMKRLGAVDKKHITLAAEIMGTTTGTFHPHEDGSVFKAIVNMSQANLQNALVIGVGSWGSHNQEPAAPRYVKCYLSEYAMSMFDPDEMTCVPMDKSYNGKAEEPRFLPAKLPHLLLGGCSSIAPGFRGEIPPCSIDWVTDAVFATINKEKIVLPKQLAHRWGGRLLNFEKSWLRDGTGSGTFVPRVKVERNNVVITTLAPGLNLETIEKRLDKDAAFGGLAEESTNENELVRIVVRAKRGHNLEDFSKRIIEACQTKEHYSFLQIRQVADKIGDIDYEPVTQGVEAFLQEWVAWRKQIVAGAAKHRISVYEKDIAKIELLQRMIAKRKELFRIADNAKNRDDIRKRVKVLLKCTEDEAREAMEYPWPRLATLEVPPLLAKKDLLNKNIIVNQKIIAKPVNRLLDDAESTLVTVKNTIGEALQLETGSARNRRDRGSISSTKNKTSK